MPVEAKVAVISAISAALGFFWAVVSAPPSFMGEWLYPPPFHYRMAEAVFLLGAAVAVVSFVLFVLGA
jgi:hypothetical protein